MGLVLAIFQLLVILFSPQLGLCSRSRPVGCSTAGFDMMRSSSFDIAKALKADASRLDAIASRLPQKQQAKASSIGGHATAEIPTSSALPFGTGGYFVRMGVGTPPVEAKLLLDTGSDITWLQCSDGTSKAEQKDDTAALFVPSKSSSYRPLGCSSELCKLLMENMACENDGPGRLCSYLVTYLDQSSSRGPFALERFTVGGRSGDKLSIPSIPFGCASSLIGAPQEGMGLLGMGGGSLSFFNQVSHLFGRRFSYCLVSLNSSLSKTSKLLLGDGAIKESESSFTPLLDPPSPALSTFYFVNMTGIEVDGRLLPVGGSPAQRKLMNGGTVVDSGSTLTYLDKGDYALLRDAVVTASTRERVKPPLQGVDTCFLLAGGGRIPSLTLRFAGGVALRLPEENVVIPVSDDIGCLAFAATTAPGVAILGNVQQQRFTVGFDMDRRALAFSPSGRC